MPSTSRPAESLRTGVGAALVALGALLLAVLPVGQWAEARILDEDGFLEVVAEAAENTEAQEEFVGEALQRGLQGTGLPDGVTGWLSEQLEPAVSDLVASDAYQDVWRSVAQQVHSQLLQPGTRDIGVDVSAVMQGLVDRVELPLGFDLSVPGGWELSLGEYQRPAALGVLQAVGEALPAIRIAAIVAVVLGVAVAPRIAGRAATLVAGGGAAVLGAALGAVAVAALPELLSARTAASPALTVLLEALAADARSVALPELGQAMTAGMAVALFGVVVMSGAALVRWRRWEARAAPTG